MRLPNALLPLAGLLAAAAALDAAVLTERPAAAVPAEQWVAQRVAAGQDADLQTRFPRESDRVLSAAFLKRLLTRPSTGPGAHALGVVISHAVVRGHLDLRNEDIGHDTRFLDCRFDDAVLLVQTRFRRTLALDGTSFLARADLRYLDVTGNLEANRARFRDVTFERLKVGGDFFLLEAVFDTTTPFVGAIVTGSLHADKARFGAGADFSELLVQRHARFSEAVFHGPTTFNTAEVEKTLDFSRAQFTDASDEANFFSIKVGRNAVFSEATFVGGFWLVKGDIGGNLVLEQLRAPNPGQRKNLNGVKADVLILRSTQLAPPYWLSGMTYRIISDEPASLLRLVSGAEDNVDAMKSLEAFHERHGQPEAAKAVHVARRRQERAGAFWDHPADYVWNVVQDWVAGYGRHLERALLWSLVVVAVGCLVFWRREWMETQDAESPRHSYNAFWYSLALFLPISGLDDAKVWMPRRNRWKTRIYMRLHIILGYLLIPIGIAAWTGIIK
jgi:hypothetical protein